MDFITLNCGQITSKSNKNKPTQTFLRNIEQIGLSYIYINWYFKNMKNNSNRNEIPKENLKLNEER